MGLCRHDLGLQPGPALHPQPVASNVVPGGSMVLQAPAPSRHATAPGVWRRGGLDAADGWPHSLTARQVPDGLAPAGSEHRASLRKCDPKSRSVSPMASHRNAQAASHKDRTWMQSTRRSAGGASGRNSTLQRLAIAFGAGPAPSHMSPAHRCSHSDSLDATTDQRGAMIHSSQKPCCWTPSACWA